MPHDDTFRWHQLSWLVGLVSMTGRILPQRRPQSLLIIAEPGTGKNALLERFKPEHPSDLLNPHMVFGTNASAWGMEAVLTNDVPRGATHMVIPEFQSLMLRRGGVWETLLGLLLPAMDEGVGDIFVGPKRKSFGGARLGLIAGMPTDSYNEHYADLRKVGLLSRFLVVRYERDPEDVRASRHRYDCGDISDLTKIQLDLPPEIQVDMSASMANAITDYAASVNAHEINRLTTRFQLLVRAIAHASGRSAVELKDLYALVDMQHFWR